MVKQIKLTKKLMGKSGSYVVAGEWCGTSHFMVLKARTDLGLLVSSAQIAASMPWGLREDDFRDIDQTLMDETIARCTAEGAYTITRTEWVRERLQGKKVFHDRLFEGQDTKGELVKVMIDEDYVRAFDLQELTTTGPEKPCMTPDQSLVVMPCRF